jgi:hypothetical protein
MCIGGYFNLSQKINYLFFKAIIFIYLKDIE